MSTPKQKEYSAVEQEILVAVGELFVAQLKGRDELAHAVFKTLVPQFINRYPQHKILTHIVLGQIKEETDEELKVRLNTGTALSLLLTPHKNDYLP